MLLQLTPPFAELSIYGFLWNKMYEEKGCLLYPSSCIAGFGDDFEELFCNKFLE